jgi:hypothetical protein
MKRKRKVRATVLDASDVAAILAALRLFQREYKDCSIEEIGSFWPDHFSYDTDASMDQEMDPEPLGAEAIDELCERINYARTLVLL